MVTHSRTPYTILGCLTIGPMSGYDVKQFIDSSIVYFWSESYGQIYPTLRRLENEGLVEGRVEAGQRGKDKRVYRITDAGRAKLEAWLQQPADPVTPRYEHSLKLFFGNNTGPEAALGHLRRLREQTEEALAAYGPWEKQLELRAESEPGSAAPYWLVVLRGGIRYSRMVLEWCDESEGTLRSLQPAGSGAGPEGQP